MINNMANYRGEIINSILPYARRDQRLFLLVCDMGFGVADQFKAEFPDRIFNMGIMEQATVSIAAGMAMSGLIPVVYTIVNFLVYRALEQVRNDIVLQGLNVKMIGTGANDYFGFLGSSHCCGQDDKRLMDLVGVRVFDPYEVEGVDFDSLVHAWMTDPAAGYIRV
jgi:transketolase